MAIPLTLGVVRKLFKADMRLSGYYDVRAVQDTFLVQGVDLTLDELEVEALITSMQNESETTAGISMGLRFEFTLFHKRTKTMALLGQGTAGLDRRLDGYGPRFSASAMHVEEEEARGNDDRYEGRLFGEGAEFLCAVPLFAWFFVSSTSVSTSDGEAKKTLPRVSLDALAIEVHYVDTADTSVRPQDELLECLYQIIRKELVWV